MIHIYSFNYFIFGWALYKESSSQTSFEGFKDDTDPVLLNKSGPPPVFLSWKDTGMGLWRLSVPGLLSTHL